MQNLELDYNYLRFGEVLGQGSFGEVWKGNYMKANKGKGEIVAIKKFHRIEGSSFSSSTKNRLHDDYDREMKTLEEFVKLKIVHENLVRYCGWAKNGQQTYIILEYCNAGDLRKLVLDKKHIDERQMIDIFLQIAQGMAHLHSKDIIHRDLKPENILLHKKKGTKLTVKVGDFGLAKPLSGKSTTVSGTPDYCAPEIRRQKVMHPDTKAIYTLKADVFSFGIIVYELVTGRFPKFRNTKETNVTTDSDDFKLPNLEEIPTFWRKIIEECLEMCNDKRPNFTDLVQMLNDELAKMDEMSTKKIKEQPELIKSQYQLPKYLFGCTMVCVVAIIIARFKQV